METEMLGPCSPVGIPVEIAVPSTQAKSDGLWCWLLYLSTQRRREACDAARYPLATVPRRESSLKGKEPALWNVITSEGAAAWGWHREAGSRRRWQGCCARGQLRGMWRAC